MHEYESDLLSTNHGVFRYEDREKILKMARERETSGEAWSDVVRDFHSGEPRYWGFPLLPFGHKDSKRPKNEDELRRRDITVFITTALISSVFIKGLILYFGLNYSGQQDDGFGDSLSIGSYGWGLAITLAFSFSSLIIFAIRHSRRADW